MARRRQAVLEFLDRAAIAEKVCSRLAAETMIQCAVISINLTVRNTPRLALNDLN